VRPIPMLPSHRCLRRRLSWCLTLALLWASPTRAVTLDSHHEVWSNPSVSQPSLRAAIEELRLEETLRKRDERGKRVWAKARILVLPVYYIDGDEPAHPSRDDLQSLFFGPHEESVRGYFDIVSGGRCEISGEVLDWRRMPLELRLYRNVLDGMATSPFLAGPRLLVRDAVRAAAPVVDLSAFDGDGPDGEYGSGDDDGFIDLLVVLHPDEGFETSVQSEGPAMLAHQSFLRVLDDSLAGEPAMARNYVVASAKGPLGVWVHEISHLLGLNDLYDLDTPALPDDGQGGLGVWSLMASGTWGGDGSTPSGLDAYSRRQLGWDMSLSNPGAVTSAGEQASAKIEPLGEWREEHFLVEVRGPSGSFVDAALPGGGALVYHVDPGVANAAKQSHRAVALLQADGRDDLGMGVNDGDETDPFPQPGAHQIDGNTTPSTRSHDPGVERIPPVIRFQSAGEGSVAIDWQLHPSGALRLVSSGFDGGDGTVRTHLMPNERAEWALLFDAVGTPASAQLRAVSIPSSYALYGSNPVALQSGVDGWAPVTSWELEALSSTTPIDAQIELELTVDGGTARRLQVGAPIQNSPGLSTARFAEWSPVLFATNPPVTTFAPLMPSELPATTAAGFELVTQGSSGYSEFGHCALLSPWFATEGITEFQLWSSSETERAFDGQAWDGGTFEILLPELGWRPLLPEGGPVVLITPRSEAATRDRYGFGGRRVPWTAYRFSLPQTPTPVRVRLRFGSDTIPNTGFWSVADAGSFAMPARATLDLRALGGGQIVVDVTLAGDLTDLVGSDVQLRWRRPHEDDWRDLAARHTIDSAGTPFTLEDALPGAERAAAIGLFVDVGANPPLLLGSAGYRAPVAAPSLTLSSNPATEEVWFLLETSLGNAHLDVYDLRGRRVRSLRAGVPLRSVRWDGRDSGGTRVASGVYVVILREDSSVRRKLTWYR